jgi:hypothetical protein
MARILQRDKVELTLSLERAAGELPFRSGSGFRRIMTTNCGIFLERVAGPKAQGERVRAANVVRA